MNISQYESERLSAQKELNELRAENMDLLLELSCYPCDEPIEENLKSNITSLTDCGECPPCRAKKLWEERRGKAWRRWEEHKFAEARAQQKEEKE